MIKQSIKTENRISTLEANYKSLDEKVDKILNNDLVHISSKMDNLYKKIDENQEKITKDINDLKLIFAKWSGIIIGAIFIIQLAVKFLK